MTNDTTDTELRLTEPDGAQKKIKRLRKAMDAGQSVPAWMLDTEEYLVLNLLDYLAEVLVQLTESGAIEWRKNYNGGWQVVVGGVSYAIVDHISSDGYGTYDELEAMWLVPGKEPFSTDGLDKQPSPVRFGFINTSRVQSAIYSPKARTS